MLTLLPYPNYQATAQVLDTRRLGKQRRKILQILNVLHRVILVPGESGQKYIEGNSLEDQPAFKMWAHHELALCAFGLEVCDEWIRRGGVDNVATCLETHMDWASSGSIDQPEWFGDVDYHLAQQSYLIRKDPLFYSSKFPDVPADLPLVWPV